MPAPRYYIVSYDICDRKRYREVHETVKGYGRRIHYSVFGCELAPRQCVEMERKLSEEINHDEDRILILDLGEIDREPEKLVTFLGTNPELTDGDQVVV